MRRLLLAVTTLLFLANCTSRATVATGAAMVASGVVLKATAGDDHREEDGHSWNLGPSSSDVQSASGTLVIATGAVLVVAGLVKASKEHDRAQEAARRAQQAELETWRAQLNTVATAEK